MCTDPHCPPRLPRDLHLCVVFREHRVWVCDDVLEARARGIAQVYLTAWKLSVYVNEADIDHMTQAIADDMQGF